MKQDEDHPREENSDNELLLGVRTKRVFSGYEEQSRKRSKVAGTKDLRGKAAEDLDCGRIAVSQRRRVTVCESV